MKVIMKSLIVCCVLMAVGLVHAQIAKSDITVDLELIADGLTAPVSATHAGDGSGRLFIVDQAGAVRVVADDILLAEPFLDFSDRIVLVNPFFDERGMLGLAFHPEYQRNGRFFVRYSAPRDGTAGEPCFGTSRGCHSAVLAEFMVSANPNLADRSSGAILFEIEEPQFNHNSGGIAFGPDGMLYFTLGDGGGANDGLADIPPSHGPIGNAQDIDTVLGSILRIDVDGGAPYAVPSDNPFVGGPGADEIYAYGLRNPYRFSFDRKDGRLFLADVGQNRREEIDIIRNGGNYGWVTREGFDCFDPFAPTTPPATCPDTGAFGEPLRDPIADYDHSEGLAIIGGYVYRGRRFPELRGQYVFGDFSRTFFPAAGRLFHLNADGGTPYVISEFRIGVEDDTLDRYVLGLGEDEAGELYLLTSSNLGPSGETGRVERIGRPGPVEICHSGPGNARGKTLVVNVNAVAAHLAHGDSTSSCEAE